MRVEKTGEQALSTQPEPTGSSPGSAEDDGDPAVRRARAVTERGWVVDPSPAPVFSITQGAPGSPPAPGSTAAAPGEPPPAPDLPIGGLRQLKAVLDRKDRSREGAERAPALAVGVAEVSNDLAATSGLIERAAPRVDDQRSRAVTPARVVVDAGWADASSPASRAAAPAALPRAPAGGAPAGSSARSAGESSFGARARMPRSPGLGSAPPPIPIAPPLRPVAAGATPGSARASAAPARPPATPAATSAPRSTGPTRVVPPVGPIASAGFPRSAAERAGATARPARVAQPVPERRAAVPARPPVSARVSAELVSIEPPERLPLGSVTAPLPTGGASLSRRPSTVELPTLDEPELPAVVAPPSPAARVRASRPAAVAAPDRALPSILSVIDRRHAPAGASLGAELPGPRIIAPSVVAPTRMPAIPAVLAAPPPVAPEVRLTSESVASPEVSFASEPIALPEVTIEVESGAVPEPIALEVSVPTERMVVTPSFAPEPVEPLRAPSAAPAPWSIDSELHLDSLPPASAPRVETPSPAAAPARPRQRRSASFSDADAAFFAAGEQMERGEVDGFDDVDDPVPSLRPQPLWRRITGRHRAG